MPVPTTIADLDPVAANNSPAGSENVGPNLDNYIRAHAAFIKQISDAQAAAIEAAIKNHLPATMIAIHRGSVASIPATWQLCDGTNGTADLRDKFVLGAGSGTYPPGTAGGASMVTLTTAQIPSHNHTGSTAGAGVHNHGGVTGLDGAHNHTWAYQQMVGTSAGGGSFANGSGLNHPTTTDGAHTHGIAPDGSHAHSFTTDANGGGGAHENMPPYYALCYIQKVWP